MEDVRACASPLPPTAAAAMATATSSDVKSGTSSGTNSNASGSSGSSADTAAASRMRHIGRLKSFSSSRQRLAPPPPPQPPAAAVASAKGSSGGGRRWGHRASSASAAEATHRRLPDTTDDETKESVAEQQTAARLRHVQQQIQQTRPLQRAQCVRLTCAAPPDLVLPYLYGDRKSRINAIMHDTGCTIDFCPLSPGDEPQSPRSRAYILNFLVSGESAASLEEAMRLLRALVEKVETHLQKKMRIRSLHAMSRHRALGVERPGAQDRSEASGSAALYAADFTPSLAKTESGRSAEQREREQFTAIRRTHSPAALETPIDRYHRLSHPGMRHDDDFAHPREYQERTPRMTVQVDSSDDATVYYDRWGRPVFRQGHEMETGEFGLSSGGDADRGGAADHPALSQTLRSTHRRRWQYVDESEWRELPRGFVGLGEDRDVLPVPTSDRRAVLPPVPPHPYVAYRHNDPYAEYAEFDEGRRVHFASPPRAPPASCFPAEERYSDFETEDLLEREEDLLAAQEYALASRAAQSEVYATRRGGVRQHSGSYYHEAASPPPRYLEQRAVRSGSISRYPHRYFDDQDGEWLTDEDEHGVVYRRYLRHPAMPYPRMYASSSSSRPRSSSFPSPGRHSRPVPSDSPEGGGMHAKRRKTSGMSYDGEFARTDHARAQVPVSRPPFDTTRSIPGQEDEGVMHHGQVYRDEPMNNAVASIEVPLSDESSPSSSPGVDIGDASRVYERERCVDNTPESCQQSDSTSEAPDKSREEDTGVAMDECNQVGNKPDQLQGAAAVVDVVANAISVEEASDSATPTDVTSHDAIADKSNSETFASSGHTLATTSDHDRTDDTVMLTAPEEPSISVAAPATVEEDPHAGDMTTAQLAPGQPAETLPHRSNWRTRANDLLIAALHRDAVAERERLEIQSKAASQRAKLLTLEERSKLLAQLDALASVVYDLQCQLVSSSSALDLAARREMLDVLDTALQASTRPETTTAEKLALLREGLESALSRCDLEKLLTTALPSPHAEELAAEAEYSQPAPVPHPRSPVTSTSDDKSVFEDTTNHWDSTNSSWFEEGDDQYDTELLAHQDTGAGTTVGAEGSPADKRSPKRGESLVLKKRGDSALTPSSASSYASHLFLEVAACSPSSFVMKGMQKRLFGEIERANAYYYLHPVKPFEANRVRPPQTVCDFGCGGGSAPAWVQKVISQITSRMKWFDEITYSLARARSGADASSDRLNRKKMNSTIRKLHLMAIQLHCVVSHLYCLRGRSECKESDSLPAALNSSYFEKRMIAYKSRLKLDADMHGTPDELLRDTFEFFPEFLFCIEMWGYDYREGIEASASSSNSSSRLRASSKALPLRFFERIEASVFDYEADRNGFLQNVCEELLTIVCLWNDFVWGDNLKTLPVERIAAFEADIKKSTAKILQTYALHLMGAWAVRLMANPDELRSLRFTQQNAYYAESSTKARSGFTSSSIPKIRVASTISNGDKSNNSSSGVDDDERSIASTYWQQKAEEEVAAQNQNQKLHGPHSPSPLSVDEIEKWSKETAAAHLLTWSRVFQMRCALETCGVVVSDVLKSASAPPLGDRSSETGDAAELLQLCEQAHVVGADAVGICEKIALHFASFQLPQEPQPPAIPATAVPSASASEPLLAKAVAESTPPIISNSSSSSSSSSSAMEEEASKEVSRAAGESASTTAAAAEQQDVKDLTQILASTRKEIEEIFCARTRSGRVRDKLQAQSVQLAQQTIDLLRTIAARRTE